MNCVASLEWATRTASHHAASSSYCSRPATPTPQLSHPSVRRPGTGRAAPQRALSQTPNSGSGFPQSFGGLLKRIQNGLPIVGLLSKLVSPTGFGVDEIAYPEYCRNIYDLKSDQFEKAIEALENKHGRPARPRYVLLMLWMSLNGAGLVAPQTIMASARRVRVTFDMEIEIERFEGQRDAKIKEYGVASKPAPKLSEQMDLAVDSLCQLLFGVGEGKLPSGEDIKLLRPLLTSVVQGDNVAGAVQQSLLSKPSRAARAAS